MHTLPFLTICFEPIVYFGLSEVFKNLNLLKFSTSGSRYLHTLLRVQEKFSDQNLDSFIMSKSCATFFLYKTLLGCCCEVFHCYQIALMLMYHALKLSNDISASLIPTECGTLTNLFAGFLNLLLRCVFEIVQIACIY